MPTDVNTAEDLQHQMRCMRASLDVDMQELVENARVMTGWRFYIRTYPWLCMAAAALAGYWIVPRRTHLRRAEAENLAERAAVKAHERAADAGPKWSLGGTLRTMAFDLGGKVAMSYGMALLGRYLNNYLNNQFGGASEPATPQEPTHQPYAGGPAEHD